MVSCCGSVPRAGRRWRPVPYTNAVLGSPAPTPLSAAGPAPASPQGALPALKEWGAVAHALLQGRQTVLLRKGGIHEKRFVVGEDRFVIFPTVAHSHAERVRPEHADLLPLGARDAQEDEVTVRVAADLVAVVEVAHPQRLPEIADTHIWTDESVRIDRVEFRPKLPLQALVVRARPLADPVVLPRIAAYAGCRSWVELPVAWPQDAAAVVADDVLAATVARLRGVLAS